MPKKEPVRWFRAEVVFSISALIVSICALVVSWIQVRVESRQMASSVWPRLSWEVSSDVGSGGYLRWQLSNKGVGPAVIREQIIRFKGKEYPHFWALVQEGMPDSLRLKEAEAKILYGSYYPDDILAVGESHDMLSVRKSDGLVRWCDARMNFLLKSPDFELRFVYADVFGNTWELNKSRVRALSD